MQGAPVLPRKPSRHQRGAALLIFMLIFFLASTSWLLSQTTSSRMRIEANKVTSAALAQAKDALIGRAALDDDRPGSLPCPDTDDDEKSNIVPFTDNCVASIGRLPTRALDLPDLRDGDGNRLWYVLSEKLNDRALSEPINPKDTVLDLTLDGTPNIAAIVFSAGSPLATQSGRPSNDVTDYLDGTNNSGGPYSSGPSSSSINDKLIAIKRDELFTVVNRRILGRLSVVLANYYSLKAEYPTNIVNLDVEYFGSKAKDKKEKEMIENNGWYDLTSYSFDTNNATLTVGLAPVTSTCTITPALTSCTHP